MVNASVGGPLIALGGATFPTPIVDVGGGYGVRDGVPTVTVASRCTF